jgi:cystathionine beta-synthase
MGRLASLHEFMRVAHLLSSIRNYMSKPWFLKMALEAEPSPLAKQISGILKDSRSEVETMSESLANGIAARTQPNIPNRPDAPDEVFH